MHYRHLDSLFFVIILICLFGLFPTAYSQDKNQAVPEALLNIMGTFTGVWTSYGIDNNGQVITKVTWTDTIKLENPVVQKDRAFAHSTDNMYFEGGHIPPMKVEGTEGFFINEDGSIGEHYFETYGQIYRLNKLGENCWAYAAAANPQEMAMLGFPNVTHSQHILVKEITDEEGVETHRITRVTTVSWKDTEAKKHWLQYVSLQGFHKKL
ncbi:MAG: hypothetical protein JXA92_07115 [candidate division Zixibacteria bacterium]|nr:hypothetical protein [candidate division Zixibacteria bacterium]